VSASRGQAKKPRPRNTCPVFKKMLSRSEFAIPDQSETILFVVLTFLQSCTQRYRQTECVRRRWSRIVPRCFFLFSAISKSLDRRGQTFGGLILSKFGNAGRRNFSPTAETVGRCSERFARQNPERRMKADRSVSANLAFQSVYLNFRKLVQRLQPHPCGSHREAGRIRERIRHQLP